MLVNMVDTPARRLRSALEPIAALSFHSRPAIDAFAAAGLDEFGPWYTWSRSSVLGPADPSVVVAAFGVWDPHWVTSNLETGRDACSLHAIRAAADAGAGEAVRTVLDGADPSDVVVALRRGIEVADVAGRALFAGHRALAPSDDGHVDLWRAATAWRELRGDSNLAACVAHGVSGLQANLVNELHTGYELFEYTATRNWSETDMHAAADALRERGVLDGDRLSSDGQRLRDEIEAATDAGVAAAIAAVGDDLDHVVRQANEWSRLIVDRGWFPDDDQKRAAG